MVPFRSENPSKISFERSLNTLENCVYTQKIKLKRIQRPKWLNAWIRAMGNGFPEAALDENGFLVIGAPEFLLRFLREEY